MNLHDINPPEGWSEAPAASPDRRDFIHNSGRVLRCRAMDGGKVACRWERGLMMLRAADLLHWMATT
ncbi:MAG: hypothetical protein GY913_21595 [Proteobacteria bacterium]|nr:hypothetical protein [Actinomycetes bacterium]MCP4919504.1 hypothetical protein [Pseudomonadota bacterium]